MTKERLEGFHKLLIEATSLELRIAETPDTTFDWDTVSGSVESVIKKRHKMRLAKLMETVEKETDAVMDFIESIDNGLMREALTLCYVDGYSIRRTAQKIGYSEGHLSKLLAGILEKLTDDNGQ